MNNVGFGYRQQGRLDEAEEYLRRSVALDDRLQAAHLNLIVVFLRRAQEGQSVPSTALVHAEKAAEIGPLSAALYQAIAELYGVVSRHDAALVRKTITYVKKAVESVPIRKRSGHHRSSQALSVTSSF